jgi:hypothetical protein
MKLSLFPCLITAVAAASNCGPSRNVTDVEQGAIFNEFVQKFYFDKNVSAAFLDHVDESYIQHNPYALSGRQRAM